MRPLLLLLVLIIAVNCYSQDIARVNKMYADLNKSKSVDEKVEILNQLAQYYYIYKLDKSASHILDSAVSIAEFSGNEDAILKARFANAILSIYSWTSWTKKETFDYAIDFLNNSLKCAEQKDKNWNYKVLAYIRLASIYRKRGRNDSAQMQLTLANAYLPNVSADSIEILYYIEQGDIHKETGYLHPAFANYSTALAKTYDNNNIVLRSEIYHHFFELYLLVNDQEAAKKQLENSRDLNIKFHNKAGLCFDYIDFARLTDNEKYIGQADTLANETGIEFYKLYVKRIRYSWYIGQKDANNILKYLEVNRGVDQYFKNPGIAFYNWTQGNIYKHCGNYSKALSFYKLAQNELLDSYDDNIKIQVYQILGDTYAEDKNNDSTQNKKNNDTAISYFLKAYNLAISQKNIASLNSITETLANLYAQQKLFDSAYKKSLEAKECKAQLSVSAATDKLALMNAKNEEKAKQDKDYQNIKNRYLFITLIIASIFITLVLMGAFHASKLMIRIAGYIAFISLFEFFVLLIDYLFHEKLHLDPVWIWIAKIGIIASMVPFQHFLEHRVVEYLASNKLIIIRKKHLHRTLSKENPNPVKPEQTGDSEPKTD